MRIRQRLHDFLDISQDWLLAACLVFILYWLFDTVVYLSSLDSGRISTLSCVPNAGQPLCTVRIYGLREIYQESFRAADFIKAEYDWNRRRSTGSDGNTYGITLITQEKAINFVHPYQYPYRYLGLSALAQKINHAFDGEQYLTEPILYWGLNPSLFKRAGLVLLGLWGVLYISRRSRNVQEKITGPGKEPGYHFSFISWWMRNAVARLVFYLSLIFIWPVGTYTPAGLHGDFLNAWSVMFCSDENCSMFPFGPVCLYPFVAFATFQAIIQWGFLKRTNIAVSRGWIVAPALASLPLAFQLLVFPVNIDDCYFLKLALSGFGSWWGWIPPLGESVYTFIGVGANIYLLLVGCIQWRTLPNHPLRKGWIMIPWLNISTLIISGLGLGFVGVQFYLPDSIHVFLGILTFFGCLIFQDVVSGIYLFWFHRTYEKFAGKDLEIPA